MILVSKSNEKRSLGRQRRGYVYNIKMYLSETEWDGNEQFYSIKFSEIVIRAEELGGGGLEGFTSVEIVCRCNYYIEMFALYSSCSTSSSYHCYYYYYMFIFSIFILTYYYFIIALLLLLYCIVPALCSCTYTVLYL
jgi:hypothetical protein